MSTRIVGSVTWEKMVRDALKPVETRPAGSMTYTELCERFGLQPSRNSSREHVTALLTAGLLRRVKGTQVLGGRLQAQTYYVPVEPKP